MIPGRKTTQAERRKLARDGMRSEYDFSKAVQGKYHKRITQESNVVVLDPDIAAASSNSEVANEALRNLLRVTKNTERLITCPGRRSKTHAD